MRTSFRQASLAAVTGLLLLLQAAPAFATSWDSFSLQETVVLSDVVAVLRVDSDVTPQAPLVSPLGEWIYRCTVQSVWFDGQSLTSAGDHFDVAFYGLPPIKVNDCVVACLYRDAGRFSSVGHRTVVVLPNGRVAAPAFWCREMKPGQVHVDGKPAILDESAFKARVLQRLNAGGPDRIVATAFYVEPSRPTSEYVFILVVTDAPPCEEYVYKEHYWGRVRLQRSPQVLETLRNCGACGVPMVFLGYWANGRFIVSDFMPMQEERSSLQAEAERRELMDTAVNDRPHSPAH